MRPIDKPKKKEVKMTKDQFQALREGDIIGIPGKTPRRVNRVSLDRKDPSKAYLVELLKLRESWTSSPYTLYGWNDIKYKYSVISKKSLRGVQDIKIVFY